jgi:DNA-binding transcriptional LysR family regulator
MRPSGRLRVHSMSSIGQHYVVPAIAKYRERYPEVRFELTLSPRMPDLLEEGYDVSVTLASELEDSGLVAQPLGRIYGILCASPGYLAKRGTPRKPTDLLAHSCLQLLTPITPSHRWVMECPKGTETIDLPTACFTVNHAESMAGALAADMGIGILPSSSALPGLRDGSLVQVLPEYQIMLLKIWALYASRQYLDAKIKTWIEFLRETLPATLAADEAALNALVKS